MAKTISEHSLWLPGFDPEQPPSPAPVPPAPDPPVAARSTVPDTTAVPAPATAIPEVAVAPEISATPRPNWRSRTSTPVEPASSLWAPLTKLDIPAGPVGKFEANLAAIDLLDQLSAEHQILTDEQRTALQHFTGWGGLPASFNLDSEDAGWKARAIRLQQHLNEVDYAAARASVNNGHYTDLPIVQAIWQAIEGFGFRGGRILEPSAGIGHFIGAMPPAIAANSRVTAIELDRISGRLLDTLYGRHGVDVRIAALEKTALAEGWFDLVVGNVPFGNYPVADLGNRPYAGFSIHNYFLGRALDVVRPGGLVCLISSSHTLEANDGKVRQYLASQAQLLGAIRLPKGAFERIASTQVQTDITSRMRWITRS